MPCSDRSTLPGSLIAVTKLHGTESGIRTDGEPSRGSDLPGAAAKDGHTLAVRGEAVDVELVRADHEVDVGRALVDAADLVFVDEEREAAAERDVARGVLVEQRLEEDGAQRPDAAG